MVDLVVESSRAGKLVLLEECARDGAQAKTLMTAAQRIAVAREQGRIFGESGPRQVIFAAGFPSIAPQEREITRRVAAETTDRVSPSAVCRGTALDVDMSLGAMRGIPGARIMVILPASAPTASAMTHTTPELALAAGLETVRSAVQYADGTAVDVCLVDVPRADRSLVADTAARLSEVGAGVVVLADTIGQWHPHQAGETFAAVQAQAGPDVVLGTHFHNDLGLGLANSLAAARAGARVVSSSWLGIAERSGLPATEQVLFATAYEKESTAAVFGPDADPWWEQPDLTLLPGIAATVSEITGVPIDVTTPIVGSGVGSISTGTPFAHPRTYQPFDPQTVLGVRPTVLLTHLASRRVVRVVATELGHELDEEQATAALAWVKNRAYTSGQAVVPRENFAGFLDGLCIAGSAGTGQWP
ncbi:hypothetical protein [Kineosporia succinea]|uniref:2-isopropylmalate synthase n=1 Tax=Kineosporia succinea TaxID=84632 RepID=A0ABT9PEB2_9ACTN|nr:hypothetical protein [Kineosporia succinea]MDP9831055.1 2-isopropylmalate synthase [Kineosporia succinea]